jgi:purine-cytosine permease-like protein
VFLGAGVATYLAGLALFRWLIRARSLALTLLMGLLAILTTFIGLKTTPIVQLTVLVLILVAGLAVDYRMTGRQRLLA